MPRKTVSGRGPQGIAKVQVSPDRQLVKINFKEGGEHVLKMKECQKGTRPGIWYIGLNMSKDKMYSIRPVDGMFTGKTLKFASPKDKPPTPKEDNFGDLRFTVILEITDGSKARGMQVPLTLKYWFYEEMDEQGRKVVGLEQHPKSKYWPIFEGYIIASGADERPLPYKDNILPMLETVILRADRSFKFTMQDGWVNSIYAPRDN